MVAAALGRGSGTRAKHQKTSVQINNTPSGGHLIYWHADNNLLLSQTIYITGTEITTPSTNQI